MNDSGFSLFSSKILHILGKALPDGFVIWTLSWIVPSWTLATLCHWLTWKFELNFLFLIRQPFLGGNVKVACVIQAFLIVPKIYIFFKSSMWESLRHNFFPPDHFLTFPCIDLQENFLQWRIKLKHACVWKSFCLIDFRGFFWELLVLHVGFRRFLIFLKNSEFTWRSSIGMMLAAGFFTWTLSWIFPF